MPIDTYIFISNGKSEPLPDIWTDINKSTPGNVVVEPVGDVADLLKKIGAIPPNSCKRLDIIGHSGTKSIQLGHDEGGKTTNHQLGALVAKALSTAIFGAAPKLSANAEVRFIGCFTAAKLEDLVEALQRHAQCKDVVLKATKIAILHSHYKKAGKKPTDGPHGENIFLEFPC